MCHSKCGFPVMNVACRRRFFDWCMLALQEEQNSAGTYNQEQSRYVGSAGRRLWLHR